MKYDIFISYSRKDIEFARKVCAVLDNYKQYYDFEYFFDQSEIASANEYLDRISSAICDSKAVLFIASKDAYASKFCAKELLYADNKNKSIHQYRIDKADVPQKLEMLLGTHQYRELSSTPIESEVREVLMDVLGCNVLSLEELKAKEIQYKSEDHDVQPKIQKRGWLKRPAIWLSAVAVVVITVLMTVLGTRSDDVSLGNNSDNEECYSVGDFYDDGTKQGVVFEVSEDGKHGKIVSLNEAELQWCPDEQCYKNIWVGANSATDGKFNTDVVMQSDDCAEYPVFKWCREQGDDWYLPSADELLSLYCVKNQVNKQLSGRCKEMIDYHWYWSSTEDDEFCAWRVTMRYGITTNFFKDYDHYVRAVSAF